MNTQQQQQRPEDMDQTMFHEMCNSKWYHWSDPYIQHVSGQSRKKMLAINAESDDGKRSELLRGFFNCKPDATINLFPPLYCEYGFQTTVGDDVYINFNCCFNDVGKITIGDRVLFGPQVQLYTASHPLLPEERNGTKGHESSKPIAIGNDCWIGGASIILGGVTIGDGSTVAAGAVVTKDVPSRVVVAGNPARVVKELPPPAVASH